MNKTSSEIKAYWENRASTDSTAQSTTMDIWLRYIEAEYIKKSIHRYQPKMICDVGCGDGLTTINCAKENPSINFFGFDYSESMIRNAERNANFHQVNNVSFSKNDIAQNLIGQSFDFIFTTRCLINLENWHSQRVALDNIYKGLSSGGIYLMIENFQEGQDLFNSVRREFGLSEIAVRDHNYFFERPRLFDYLAKKFEILEEVNISSTYYLVSRIIYSSICSDNRELPNYNDIHHQLAAKLPFVGEYGPVKAIILRKI